MADLSTTIQEKELTVGCGCCCAHPAPIRTIYSDSVGGCIFIILCQLVCSVFIPAFKPGSYLKLLYWANLPIISILAVWAMYLSSKGEQIQQARTTRCTNCLIWTFCCITIVISVLNLLNSWICLHLDLEDIGMDSNWEAEVCFLVCLDVFMIFLLISATRIVKVMRALQPPEYFQPPTQAAL